MQPSATQNVARKQAIELADIVRRHADDFQTSHRLRAIQRQALRDIGRCRTAELGGHRHWCPECGFERYHYHSCRNRHCPKCQTKAKADWLAARQSELLPVPYFHNVFTLPHEFNQLIGWSESNQRALLSLLFRATSQTLLEFGRQEFGGKIGFTAVLHSWDQQLRPHYHLHVLIASGALSHDRSRWVAGGSKFLFKVRALSKVFRAKYLDGVAELLAGKRLEIPPQLKQQLAVPAQQQAWLRRLRKKPWVVYSKRPFAGPGKMLDYLSRYTHRVALSNNRLLALAGDQVCFTYRDRRDGDRRKLRWLSAEEFLGRFVKHVLPHQFTRIRHYGLLASRDKRARLALCRQLLGARPIQVDRSTDELQSLRDWLLGLGIETTKCPCCGASLKTEETPRQPERHQPPIRPPPWQNEDGKLID